MPRRGHPCRVAIIASRGSIAIIASNPIAWAAPAVRHETRSPDVASPIHIYIDGEQVRVPRRRLSGAELRALVSPPADTIWVDVPDAQDRPVAPDQVIELQPAFRRKHKIK